MNFGRLVNETVSDVERGLHPLRYVQRIMSDSPGSAPTAER